MQIVPDGTATAGRKGVPYDWRSLLDGSSTSDEIGALTGEALALLVDQPVTR